MEMIVWVLGIAATWDVFTRAVKALPAVAELREQVEELRGECASLRESQTRLANQVAGVKLQKTGVVRG